MLWPKGGGVTPTGSRDSFRCACAASYIYVMIPSISITLLFCTLYHALRGFFAANAWFITHYRRMAVTNIAQICDEDCRLIVSWCFCMNFSIFCMQFKICVLLYHHTQVNPDTAATLYAYMNQLILEAS